MSTCPFCGTACSVCCHAVETHPLQTSHQPGCHAVNDSFCARMASARLPGLLRCVQPWGPILTSCVQHGGHVPVTCIHSAVNRCRLYTSSHLWRAHAVMQSQQSFQTVHLPALVKQVSSDAMQPVQAAHHVYCVNLPPSCIVGAIDIALSCPAHHSARQKRIHCRFAAAGLLRSIGRWSTCYCGTARPCCRAPWRPSCGPPA